MSRKPISFGRVFAAATMVAALMVLAACSAGSPAQTANPAPSTGPSSWADIESAARSEGTLVMATHVGSGYVQFAEKVQEKFPWLQVQATSMKASDFTARAIVEQQNGQYLWDVHVGPLSNIFTVLTPADALQPMPPFLASLPAESKDPSKWAGGFDLFTDPANPVSFVNQLSLGGEILVNRELIAPGTLTSADELIDPKYSGKIVTQTLSVSNAATMSLAALMAEKDESFIRTLVNDQKLVQVDTSRQATEWVVQGRYAIAFGADVTHLADLQKGGVGKQVERVNFGQSVLANGVSALKNAPHPNAITVFLAWFLSQEGQDTWASTSSVQSSSRRLDVKVYNPDDTPDYANIGKYKVIQGTASGDAVLNKTLAIAKQRG
jgi:ABC-type Fe3+ transport system substrate-binding protein